MLVTLTVIVAEGPEEDGTTDAGETVQVEPLGAPLQVRLTGSTKPFCPVTLMVKVPD